MQRESLRETVVVVTTTDGNEVEVEMDCGLGNLDDETSECLLIGRAVRAALMRTEDGDSVDVRAYTQ